MTTLMRNGRDRRSENPSGPTRYLSACYCPGPISGSHQGQRPHGCIATEVILQATIGRIHGCTRTLRRKVRFLLHRGHRPYMAHRATSRQRSKRSLSGRSGHCTTTANRFGRRLLHCKKVYSIPSSAATSRVCGTMSAERKSPAHVNGGAKKPESAEKNGFIKLASRVIIRG
jgi:hypothetical protein